MQSVYGLKVTLYYTTNPFICKYFFSAPQTVTAVFRYFSGFGCKIFRGDFVVIAENLYKIAAGRKTAAGGDLADLQPGGLQQFAGNLQTLGGKVIAETHPEFLMKDP